MRPHFYCKERLENGLVSKMSTSLRSGLSIFYCRYYCYHRSFGHLLVVFDRPSEQWSEAAEGSTRIRSQHELQEKL